MEVPFNFSQIGLEMNWTIFIKTGNINSKFSPGLASIIPKLLFEAKDFGDLKNNQWHTHSLGEFSWELLLASQGS